MENLKSAMFTSVFWTTLGYRTRKNLAADKAAHNMGSFKLVDQNKQLKLGQDGHCEHLRLNLLTAFMVLEYRSTKGYCPGLGVVYGK